MYNNELFDLTSYIPDIIFEVVPNVKRNGNQLQFACPICGDSKTKRKKRGTYYVREGSYYCWNGGCPANERGYSGIQFLCKLLGKTQKEVKQILFERSRVFDKTTNKQKRNKKQNDAEELDPIADIFNEKISKNTCEDKIKIIDDNSFCTIEQDWVNLPKTLQKYVDSRKIYQAPYLPKGWQLYYNKKSKRLVIPWGDNYYQERAVFDNQLDDKYKFPFNVEKPVFGLDLVDSNIPYIFLIEGLFDSIWVKNGVAIGSLKITKHQIELIKSKYPNHTLIYMPDNQFSDLSSHMVCQKKLKTEPNQLIFIWPKELKQYKDVNESIIAHDEFKQLWNNVDFLVKNSYKGLKGLMMIR